MLRSMPIGCPARLGVEDVEIIRAMRKGGMTMSEVSETIGVSLSAIYRAMRLHGAPRDPRYKPAPEVTAYRRARIHALYGQGWSVAEIKKDLGVSDKAVYYWLKRGWE